MKGAANRVLKRSGGAARLGNPARVGRGVKAGDSAIAGYFNKRVSIGVSTTRPRTRRMV